jgi:class 3 adenylate cyclase
MGTVLYADLADSTGLVDARDPHFAASVYKSYLLCAGRIVRSQNGAITAYAGDRIMAVFRGSAQWTKAAKAALQLNWARDEILNPALKERFPREEYMVNHTIGIDSSMLFATAAGVPGARDLVWVGRAANYAAKLSALPSPPPVWITWDVYSHLDASLRTQGKPIWEEAEWSARPGVRVFTSGWRWCL